MKRIQLGIVDDDNLIVDLMKNQLNQSPEMEVIFTHNNGADLFRELETTGNHPDVILLDLKMNEMNGLEVLSLMKESYPHIHCIAISSFYKTSYIGFMLRSGVAAFLSKGTSLEKLISVIKHVHANGYYLDKGQVDAARGQFAGNLSEPELSANELLTEREIEIIQLICEQKTAKEIGEILFIAQRTVEGHKNTIFVKTGVKNTAGLVIYALQHKLVDIHSIPML